MLARPGERCQTSCSAVAHDIYRRQVLRLSVMLASGDKFEQSIRKQIALNQARTPTQRFVALCNLLDVARAMAPRDEASQERRRRALAVRQREREQWRERCRQILATGRIEPLQGV